MTGDLQPIAPLWRWEDEDTFLASAQATGVNTEDIIDLATDEAASTVVEIVRGTTSYLPFLIELAADEDSDDDLSTLLEKCSLSGAGVDE